MAFVQGTSNFKLFTFKEHENSGTHNVSMALWRSGGRVTSVIRTLSINVQEGILALFHTVYKMCIEMSTSNSDKSEFQPRDSEMADTATRGRDRSRRRISNLGSWAIVPTHNKF